MTPDVARTSRLNNRDLHAAITRAKRRRDEYTARGETSLADQAGRAMDRLLEVLYTRGATS